MLHHRTIFTLLVAFIPTLNATPHAATQLKFTDEVEAQNNDNINNNARKLQLLNLDDLGGTNGTCPTDCPLCRCNSTSTENEAVNCLLTASIEACASKSFDKCYANLLPPGIDIEGLCSVQCDKPDDEIPAIFAEACRMCDIFSCCNECPSDRANECFPDIEDGYTPMGWEPATCGVGSGADGMVVNGALALFCMMPLILGLLL